jgi:hypothetical protein
MDFLAQDDNPEPPRSTGNPAERRTCGIFLGSVKTHTPPAIQESAARFLRSRSRSPILSDASTSRWVCSQTGIADASRVLPAGVRLNRRPRRSAGSLVTVSRPRRWSGLIAAVRVVRSMARRVATETNPAGSGRLSDIKRENWPLVRPMGRSASSKRRASARAARCTCRQRQQSRTRSVVSKGTGAALDITVTMLISTYIVKLPQRRPEPRAMPPANRQGRMHSEVVTMLRGPGGGPPCHFFVI